MEKPGTQLPYYDSLDKLGYSKERVEKRVKIYDNGAECLTRVTNRNWTTESTNNIIAGSRGEGTAVSWGSDLDLIFVSPDVKCFETYPDNPEEVRGYVATFELDMDAVPDGYTKLRLKSLKEVLKESEKYFALTHRLKESLTDEGYLKNDRRLIAAIEDGGENMKIEGWPSRGYHYAQTRGPARPLKYPLPFSDKELTVDFVPAFPCSIQTSVLNDWSKRKRKNDYWPSLDTVNAVKESEVLVVPVGLDGSEEQSLQWRVSYTLTERILVRSFNDTQIKVYVAMKMIVKKKLKESISSQIDSYVVKNVIFWVFEKWPGTFERKDFNELLSKALTYLRKCVDRKWLKNYITPSRNLLQRKLLEDEEKKEAISGIDTLLDAGLEALRCCPLIEDMYSLSHTDLEERLQFRQLSEELSLAVLSLKPDVYDGIEHRFHTAENRDSFEDILLNDVVRITRETNPFGFFSLLMKMETEDIKNKMVEGLKQDYAKIWMGYSDKKE